MLLVAASTRNSGPNRICIKPTCRRYRPNATIAIIIASSPCIRDQTNIYKGLSWRYLLLARLRPSKILHTARSGSQGVIRKRGSHELGPDSCLRGLRDRVWATGPDQPGFHNHFRHFRPPSAIEQMKREDSPKPCVRGSVVASRKLLHIISGLFMQTTRPGECGHIGVMRVRKVVKVPRRNQTGEKHFHSEHP